MKKELNNCNEKSVKKKNVSILDEDNKDEEKKAARFRFMKNERKPIINLKRFRKKDNNSDNNKEKKIIKTKKNEPEEETEKTREPNKIRHQLKKSCKIS